MARRIFLITAVVLLAGRVFATREHAQEARAFHQAAGGPQTSNHMSLASHYLEKGERGKAIQHFRQYLVQYPKQWDIRTFFAELLLKENRLAEAKTAFCRFLADAQIDPLVMPMQLLHGHQRLYEIALREKNDYRIHLHRGLAMFWLAQARRQIGDVKGDLSVEGILVKAVVELVAAHRLQPMQAKASWYLSLVWRQIGQTQLAQIWWRRANEHAPFSDVTPFEQWQITSANREAECGYRMLGR